MFGADDKTLYMCAEFKAHRGKPDTLRNKKFLRVGFCVGNYALHSLDYAVMFAYRNKIKFF